MKRRGCKRGVWPIAWLHACMQGNSPVDEPPHVPSPKTARGRHELRRRRRRGDDDERGEDLREVNSFCLPLASRFSFFTSTPSFLLNHREQIRHPGTQNPYFCLLCLMFQVLTSASFLLIHPEGVISIQNPSATKKNRKSKIAQNDFGTCTRQKHGMRTLFAAVKPLLISLSHSFATMSCSRPMT